MKMQLAKILILRPDGTSELVEREIEIPEPEENENQTPEAEE